MNAARLPQYRTITQTLRTQQLPFFQSTLPALFVIEERQYEIRRRKGKGLDGVVLPRFRGKLGTLHEERRENTPRRTFYRDPSDVG